MYKDMNRMNILQNLSLCENRIAKLEKEISEGKSLTNFGKYLYDSDKKDIAKLKKLLSTLD